MDRTRFIAMSLVDATQYSDPRPHIFIQIADPPVVEDRPRFPPLCREGLLATCQVWFSDYPYPNTDEWVMGVRHGRKILRFVARWVDQAEVVCVHCHRGASRSPAVAAALDFIHNGPRSQRKWIDRGFNPWVYAVMVREGYYIANWQE